jgi:Tol biopolymer transport system component
MKTHILFVIGLVFLSAAVQPQDKRSANNLELLSRGLSPINRAEPFAEGVISLGYHEHRIAISPDQTEIFYTVGDAQGTQMRLMTARMEAGEWTTPILADFSNSGDDIHPAYSPDGNRLYFASIRPLMPGTENEDDLNIWYVERQGSGWSDPINAGPSINSAGHETSPSVAQDETLYFDVNLSNGDWDIYQSEYIDGSFQTRREVDLLATDDSKEFGPFVSPDGSYILFYSNRPDTRGEADIYVSFFDTNNQLMPAINLGDIVNSKFYDWAPSVSPDGKQLIFSSYRNTDPINSRDRAYSDAMVDELGPPVAGLGSFYWIDTQVIEGIRPKPESTN